MVHIRCLLGGTAVALLASSAWASPNPEARALKPQRPAAAAKDAGKELNPNALKIFGVFPVVNVGFDMKDGGLRGYMGEDSELRLVGHFLQNGASITFKTDPADCKKHEVCYAVVALRHRVCASIGDGSLSQVCALKSIFSSVALQAS
jgi:hypothetical protein